jgi:hypothetical protein
MGYCQQQVLALKLIYNGLRIESYPVSAIPCRFGPKVIHGIQEPGGLSGHVWLRVRLGGEEREVCPGSVENRPGKVHFEILGPVWRLPGWLQPLTHLGSAMENVRRDWWVTRFHHAGADSASK